MGSNATWLVSILNTQAYRENATWPCRQPSTNQGGMLGTDPSLTPSKKATLPGPVVWATPFRTLCEYGRPGSYTQKLLLLIRMLWGFPPCSSSFSVFCHPTGLLGPFTLLTGALGISVGLAWMGPSQIYPCTLTFQDYSLKSFKTKKQELHSARRSISGPGKPDCLRPSLWCLISSPGKGKL